MSLAAIGLWAMAGSWSGSNRTDGFVPESVARRWPSSRRHALELVKAGLWENCDVGGERGWRFHDWADWQPTKDETESGPLQFPRGVPTATRFAVFERDQHRCKQCGATDLLEIDHVFPWSKGGRHTMDNLQTLCRSCNIRKGDSV